ncbi:MAG TPA: cytochrome c oxidase subunit II [Nitrospiraceae bacterium]|nr:cytochrome c oxidase subunit II [Nitrospiraceae bacterium]
MLIPEASNSAIKVDTTFSYILGIEVILLMLVTSTMIFFVIKYNRKKKETPENIEGSMFLEIIWTAIPTLLVIGMFYLGWRSFDIIRFVPKEVMTIKVTGRQWSWLFSYENGKQSDTLNVPLGKPVKMLLTSADVLHSFYIPAFRIKEDCVPGLETYLWFTAEELGTYDIFCTEYCGLGHSGMVSKVIVMPEKEFDAWYSAAPAAAKVSGLKILEEKGCLGCHTTDGTKKIGPTFKGLYESRVTVVTNGMERVITADEGYLKRMILKPGVDIVKGYPNIMPPIPVTPEELNAIVEYIKTLK